MKLIIFIFTFFILSLISLATFCLYNAIYIALKKTKEVAFTSVLGAVINIIINLLFIRKIGLYAASLSTAISYFVMMLYRYYDLKKYMKITYSKGLFLKTILIYAFALFFYYQQNFLLQVFCFIIVVIYTFVLNWNFFKTMKNFFWKKLKLIG